MSKRGYLSRYLLILKRLRAKPYSSFDDLQGYFESQVEYLQMQDDNLSIGFSKRTFQRDIKEISNLFGIDIEYSKKEKGYHIVQSEMENMNFQRMVEAFDMFSSLNLADDLAPFIHTEKRRPQGTENLYGLLHAIKNKLQIKFTYLKFWEVESTERTVEPYALKEFRNRWYVMALDTNDNQLKSFALDRLTQLDITQNSFEFARTKVIEDNYRHCFGIISPNGEKPLEIILSFDPVQGKYIKSLPLHETQEVLIDNETELQVRLKLFATYDLVMELLSFGDRVRVIEPPSLVDEIKNAHQKAFKVY